MLSDTTIIVSLDTKDPEELKKANDKVSKKLQSIIEELHALMTDSPGVTSPTWHLNYCDQPLAARSEPDEPWPATATIYGKYAYRAAGELMGLLRTAATSLSEAALKLGELTPELNICRRCEGRGTHLAWQNQHPITGTNLGRLDRDGWTMCDACCGAGVLSETNCGNIGVPDKL